MTFRITKVDPFTGKSNTMEMPITMKDYLGWKASGMMIQKAFPQLTANQREFLMTGIIPDSWDEVFKDSENATKGEGN